jgi:signal transduction histidine kinase
VRWPLRYQILLPFGGVMLAVVIVVSLLDALLAARRSQAQIERQLNGVAQTLLKANFPLTDAVLKQTSGLSGAEFLLTDDRGTLRATSLRGIETAGMPLVASPAGKIQLIQVIDLANGQFYHTAITIPPRAGQGSPLLLHILYPLEDLRAARWQAVYPPLVVGSVLLAIVVILALVIAGRVSRPILELRHELGRLVHGGFRPLALEGRNDEIGDLVQSVNLLAEELEESRRAIKRSERLALLGQLSGGLAHQLRNSVTGARIAVQLHQRSCDDADRDSLIVALRQLTLTESHLARFLTAGQPVALRRARCQLPQIAAEVIALVAPASDHRGVELSCQGADDAALELWADSDQLRELLLNLVINGVEAAGSGGWVRVELAEGEEAVIVRVWDSGSGLDERMRERLFEPFATAKPEGIGLGLVVARQIAEAHGGKIRHLHDDTTCFEVTLPRGGDGVGQPCGDSALRI